jgi:DHA2 family multidrug resistance protein
MSAAAPEDAIPRRGILTICVMLATIMQALDSTIANVALRHMQGSLAASTDEITWVLTSYTLMAAIMTPPTGFLTERMGRKNVFILTVIGFTIASALCGMAASMTQIVLFRVLQGAFGAPLVPLSQMVLLDSYPVEKHGQAMAIWGQGVMLGPILGPTLGGYFTEFYNWRWCFFINLPIGIITALGLWYSMPKTRPNAEHRFDWTGFVMLSVALCALQLVLDRGQIKDWFGSTEIVVECAMAILFFYLFFVHIFTTDRPFIAPKLFLDRNLSVGLIYVFLFGVILLASMALMPLFVQDMLDYPVFTAGVVLSPRGIGSMLAMIVDGRIIGKVDTRLIIGFGSAMLLLSLYQSYTISLDVDVWILVRIGIIQGVGMGAMFVPLSTITFASIAPSDRPAATSMFSLMRNVGSAIGVSVVTFMLEQNTQINHEQLGAHVNPYNPVMGFLPDMWNTATLKGAAALDAVVNQQATAIAYFNDFKMMAIVSFALIPLLFLFRTPKRAPSGDAHIVLE